jgi:ubiquinone/menaquinone biosynthesis C-methylase UbiE
MDYGSPNAETLAIFEDILQPGDTVVDIAGGYGRYALPIADANGCHVIIVDIDRPHLDEVERRAANNSGTGSITTIEADVLDPNFVLPAEGEYDAAFTTGFIYLAPPETASRVFDRMRRLVRIGGLIVVEFATNRIREDAEGNSLIGPDEHLYSHDWGKRVVRRLFEKMEGVQISRKDINLASPYKLHTTLLIAHGFKPKDVSE